MSPVLKIESAQGARTLAPDDLPLSLGGPDAGLPLPGVSAAEPLAWIDLSDDGVFIQAAGGGMAISCNGMPVSTSQWLRDGDRLRIGPHRLRFESAGSTATLRVEQVASDTPDGPSISVITVPAPDPASGAAELIRPIEFTPRKRGTRVRARRPGPAAFLGLAALGLVAAVLWFLVAARSVELRVEPEPERMTLRGGLSMLHAGDRYLLLPGTYRLAASLDGYRPLEREVEITTERGQTLTFTLEKLPGFLVVDTGAVEQARIVVDGNDTGRGPGEPIELEAGRHELRVLADRHLDYRTDVSIEGGGARQTLAVELTPGWAEVSFDSRPRGATVLADGVAVGTTPLDADLDPGTYEIEFRLAGHKNHVDQVTALASQTLRFPTVELALMDGRLALESDPPGATITVDGRYQGQTPLRAEIAPGAEHRVEASKPGYETAERRLEVGPGESRSLSFTLTPLHGEVELVVTPADAEVVVNGESRGAVSGTLELPAVAQEIEFRKPGYVTRRATVTPRPDLPQVLRIALVREPPPAPVRPPETLATSQGQAMVLVQGGRFEMGASRREPGRRANETLHEVELTRPFYLGRREVSNAEFRRFRPDHSSGDAGGVSLDGDEQPVVQVSWEEAALYCNWLSEQESLPPAYVKVEDRLVASRPPTTGYRLPLEAEWAWAARYAGTPGATKYAWGDSLPVPAGAGNFADASAAALLSRTLPGYDDGFPVTAPVESLTPNPLGLYHVGGNVAEWMHDVYGIHPSTATEVQKDPAGPEEGELHVIRGASWMDSTVSEVRLTYRDYGGGARPDVGFRVARTAGGKP